MANDDDAQARTREDQARFLSKETAITEAQALDLIEMLGSDRNSLLREAKILHKRNRAAKPHLPEE